MSLVTPEPYDVKLQLTVLSEVDCAKHSWRTHHDCSKNRVTFSIQTTANPSKLHPTLYDLKLLCTTNGLSTHTSTLGVAMFVTWKYVRSV